MKSVFLILFFFIPVFISAQSGGQLKGKVVNASSCNNDDCTPLDSVHIKVYSSSMHDTIYAITDSTGHFIIKPLSGGIYIVITEKHDFISAMYNGVIVSEGKTTYIENPSIKIYPIGYKEAKPKKVSEEKTPHKKKHYY